jgi:hypothetical protein
MARGYERSVQIGNAGEHFVMAHLLASGFQAFMADRGNPAFDISVVDGAKYSLLRVKCTNTDSVIWSRKKSGAILLDLRDVGDFCVIVDLRTGVADAQIYVVPTNVVQRALDAGRKDWLSKMRRDGMPRKDSTGQRVWLDEKSMARSTEAIELNGKNISPTGTSSAAKREASKRKYASLIALWADAFGKRR